MNWRDFLATWRKESEAQGFEVEVLLEKSGFPIFACSKGTPNLPTIYLSSGIHGDEPSGPQALLGLLKAGFFDDRFSWLICPVLNPTGLNANTRENTEGIDLNRDYHHCHSVEVRAHIKWLNSQKTPDLFLSLHEDWESTGFYFYEINTGANVLSYQEIIEAASPYFPAEPERVIDGHEVTEHGWIFHADRPDIPEGWPEAIFLSRMGCPLSLTFETPSSRELEKRIACHQAVIRRTLQHL
jgi:hypothetical protein